MLALTRLDKALRDEPAQLIATVHDEAVLLVPDDVSAVERSRARLLSGRWSGPSWKCPPTRRR